MASFGIIVLNQNQELPYYRNIGKHASKFGLKVHRFIPSRIDPYTEKISGETFDEASKQWQEDTFSIPDILYDRCFYSSRQAYKTNAPIVEWLKSKTTFLGFGLPGKWKVHETLKKDRYLNNYLIDTVYADQADVILEELNRREKILLKPESGSQGK
ncbi:MAG TPA: YheC/YheD family protein, partial [Bacillales bacterium]|nr:YheC/YheD family protein [Bacillales bacterium]